MSAIARRLAWRLWCLPAFALCVILGGIWASSFRVAALGLMLLLIVYHMVMSFAVLRYATLPALAARSRANEFLIEGDKIILRRITIDEETGEKSIEHIATLPVISTEYSSRFEIIITGRNLPDFVLIPKNK